MGQFVRQSSLCGRIGRKRRWAEGRQEILPNLVEHGLHILETTGDGQHGFLLREDEAELAERAIAAERAMSAAPELVAVPYRPVRVGLRVAVVRVRGRRFGDPLRCEDLRAVPFALLQVELAKPGDVLRSDVQAGSANVDSLRIGVPHRIGDAERLNSRGVR